MLNGIIVVLIVVVAIVVGQSYPMLGGLIAMFPTKMFAYAAASNPENAVEGVRGLLIGSIASTTCAISMWFTIHYGMPIALGTGIAAWTLIALIGRLW